MHLLWELIFKNWGLCRVRYKEYWSMLKLNLKLEKKNVLPLGVMHLGSEVCHILLLLK